MVTGSHNPPEYNGFKIQIGDEILSGDALRAVREKMSGEDLLRGTGSYKENDIAGRYIAHVTGDVALNRPLKVVVDAGNGIAGPIAQRLFEALDCEVIPLFCEPDGNFPNHHPDPGQPENLEALGLEVQAQEADLGIALDGDGDRVGVVDDSGAIVSPDRILMLLAADVLIRHPGADVIYDVKGSRHLAGYVLSNGGRPIMWKSGHARMRAKLHETGALLAGEFSGHFYIKERWYGFDDGTYAAARVMEILSAEMRAAKEIFDELPSSPATPEYSLPLDEGLNSTLMSSITAKADFSDAKVVELDGLRVEFADGWGLVRASNSMPSLVFRFEADDLGALERIKESFRSLLKSVDPALVAPF
jgi:phosphomannomutase/phosphoglucomutase